MLWAYLPSSSYTRTVLSPSNATNFVLRCCPRLTIEEGCVAFQSRSKSWASVWVTHDPYPTHKPPTLLISNYFYSRFHPYTSYSLTGYVIYSTRKRFCFHRGQNRKLHALPPPSAIKMTSSYTLGERHATMCFNEQYQYSIFNERWI